MVDVTRSTFDGERALVFARGLFHVAACDGIAPAEKRALTAVADALGLDYAALVALAGDGFDFAEAARVLDSTWLRRTFVRACRMMVQIDGTITAAERDTLRGAASALGVGERLALAEMSGPAPEPTSLVAWVRGLPVDFVSWDDDTRPGWFYLFPHATHPLAHGAEVYVEQGQALLTRGEAGSLDVVGPGTHVLTPALVPRAAQAAAWVDGPVRIGLLFVRTGPSPVLRWGTGEAVPIPTRELGPVPLQAYGRVAVRVCDPVAFAARFARPNPLPKADINARVRRVVAGRFGQAMGRLDVADDAALFALIEDLDALRKAVLPVMQAALATAGLSLARFDIEHLTVPLELGLQPRSKRTRTLTEVARHAVGRTAAGPDTDPVSPASPERGARASRGPRTVGDALRHCVACAASVPTDARFCSACGAPQRKRCAQCGHGLPTAARFCSGCGAPQA